MIGYSVDDWCLCVGSEATRNRWTIVCLWVAAIILKRKIQPTELKFSRLICTGDFLRGKGTKQMVCV